MEDREIAVLTSNSHRLYRYSPHSADETESPLSPQTKLQGRTITIPMDIADVEKGPYAHFMLKEIYQQPRCVRQTFAGKILAFDSIHITPPDPLTQIVFLACGTSYHASMVGRYLIETHAKVYHFEELETTDSKQPFLCRRTLVFI